MGNVLKAEKPLKVESLPESKTIDSEDFYQKMGSFSDFQLLTDHDLFQEVPDNWVIFVSDIKGSTAAIEEGRYRDVNTIGAATIACAQNGMGGRDFPFVFGGDGATLLIPPQHVETVKNELVSLKQLAKEKFQLHLRVGTIGVGEIKSCGGLVQVAKFELVNGKFVAVFRGGGLALADHKIKSENDKYEIKTGAYRKANLHGLTCRWQPIQNKNGMVLSLLVAAKGKSTNEHEENRGGQQAEIYQKVLSKLEAVFDGSIEKANPVNLQMMAYKSVQECLKDERRYVNRKSKLFHILSVFFAVAIFRFKLPGLLFKPRHYFNAMKTHSDYRKFDDMLRMTIDCSSQQKQEIEEFLENLHQEDLIDYGLHTSSEALMTCYVQSLQDGDHIHFIDGGNGGYAMAAKQLKAQMKKEKPKKSAA